MHALAVTLQIIGAVSLSASVLFPLWMYWLTRQPIKESEMIPGFNVIPLRRR